MFRIEAWPATVKRFPARPARQQMFSVHFLDDLSIIFCIA
jgi:hypothetical protein